MTEKEYIEREALVERLKKEECDCEWLWAILDIPAADVEPVRHGRWVNESFYTHCSVCGNMAIYDKYGQEVESDYCPNCGCRMDGGDDE